MLLLPFLLFSVFLPAIDATHFSVAGRVFCTSMDPPTSAAADQPIEIPPPLEGALVQLWEEDRIGPNDLLNEMTTGANGTFHLEGNEWEVGDEEPFVQIQHNCADDDVPAQEGCLYISRFDLNPLFEIAKGTEISNVKIMLGTGSVILEQNEDGDEAKVVKLATEVKCG